MSALVDRIIVGARNKVRSPICVSSGGPIVGAIHSESRISNAIARKSSLYDSPVPSTSRDDHCSPAQVSDAELLENILDEDFDIEGVELDDKSESGERNFLVCDLGPNVTWHPPKNAFSWFPKIADIDLKVDELETINKEYTPDSATHHFVPPKLPIIIWDTVKSNPADLYKQCLCFKAQSLTYTALMPMLLSLDSMDPKD